jgi:NADPH-dependent ferric siderophore reductase
MNRFKGKIISALTHEAVAIHKRQLTEHVFHVRIKGEELKNIQYVPGQYLHVFVRTNSEALFDAAKNRTYSVWSYDRREGTMDLAICTFSNGMGAQWVKQLKEGETVNFIGPSGKFTIVQDPARYFFIGDISSLSHFYELRRACHPCKKVDSLIYGNKLDLFPDLDGCYHFYYADTASSVVSQFQAKLDRLQKQELQNTFFYIGGDGNVCISINKLLINVYGISRSMIKVKPFWIKGKTGL